MAFGIQNATNVTLQNITDLTDFTGDPAKFFIKANYTIFGGWFYFIMFVVLGIIAYRLLQDNKDQPLINLMFASSIVALVSLFARGIYIIEGGIFKGMVSDFQMWIFPVVTVILATVVYFMRE